MFTPPLARSGHRSSIYALAPIPGGGFLSGSGDGQVVEWADDPNLPGRVIAEAGQSVYSLHVLSGGRLVLIGTGVGDLVLIDRGQRRALARTTLHHLGVFAIVPWDEEVFLTAGGDGTLGLWTIDGSALRTVRRISLTDAKVRAIAVCREAGRIAVACGDGTVRILEPDGMNELHAIEAHDRGSTAVAWHPNKPVLFSGGKDGHIRTWQYTAGYRAVHAWPAHAGTVYAIAFDPKGPRFATASRDHEVKLWDARTTDPIARSDRRSGGHTHSVNALLWQAGTLLSAGDDKRVLAWSVG
ncbi:MAG: hypothetical protein H6595_14480 [Flavobacteriales bacterium]|nr:hypothetical protein [Flavobacteriales bacterium]MCB9168674.1 hypothetical protein [Flavobacteriales bacterium]